MIEPAAFHSALRAHGFEFFSGVPDSLLKDLCAYIDDHEPASRHVIAANEGGAVGLATGYHLATGRFPVVYLQNSGIGNAVNPLLSVADPAVYAIPILFLIGWRGEPGIPDEPQHVTQGRVMEPLLEAIELPFTVVDASVSADDVVRDTHRRMVESRRSMALLIRRDTFAPYSRAPDAVPSVTRTEAVAAVLQALEADDAVVATTGMTSREVFAYREQHAQGHGRDFLTVGAMGHASQIALGAALQLPDRQIVCLDGDGAALMHLGSLATIGTRRPENFRHVIINNGAHDSVGGQATAARSIDLCAVARACGYRETERIEGVDGVAAAMGRLRSVPGPTLLEIIVGSRASTTAGRPTSSPADNKVEFMRALRSAP